MPATRETLFTFGPADYAPMLALRCGVMLDRFDATVDQTAPPQWPSPDRYARCYARTTALLAASARRLARSRADLAA